MKISTKIKLLDYSILVVFIFLLVLTHLNLSPASYFIYMYCIFFETNNYPTLLIASLLSLMYAFPIFLIKKNYLKQNQ